MNTIPVWQTDPAGFLIYETTANELSAQPGDYNIPYGAYTDAPPESTGGHVVRRVDDAWTVVEDHRRDTLYLVDAGVQYQIGTEVEIESEPASYDGGGPIPPWLTTDAPAPVEPAPEDESGA